MKQRNLWKRGILSLTLVFGLLFMACEDTVTPDTETTYTVSANGSPTTTSLTFAFSAEVSGLTADNITVSGSASKSGALSGSGKSYTLPITVSATGSATVKITKDGIESGTKTVTVYKGDGTNPNPDPDPGTDPDTTTETPINGGANKDGAAVLTLASADNAQWRSDSIAATDTAKWYKFTAEDNKTYHVQWWDDYLLSSSQPAGKGKTAEIKVTAYKTDGTTPINSSAWTLGWESTLSGEIADQPAGTVYLKVERNNTKTNGTYALRVYDTAAIVPQGPIQMSTASGYPSAMAKNAVYVSWLHYVPDAALTKYEIHRSTTQTGTYTKAGEVTGSTGVLGWSIASFYIDESAPEGISWYKIIAVNNIGTGAATVPVKSDSVGAHTLATAVTVSSTGAATAIGSANLTEGRVEKGSAAWYKFTGDATGGTYKVQFAEKSYPSGSTYTGDVSLSVFKGDGSYAKKSSLDFRSESTGWSDSQIDDILNVAANETIYLKFQAPSTGGTFGFKVWKDLVTTYSATADGSEAATTTKIDFVFSDDVSGLTASNITLGTGVSKGTLTGSGKNWSLGITVTTPGTISVAINKTGIESTSKTVTVYKAAAVLKPDPNPLPTTGGTVIQINWNTVLGGNPVKKAYVVVYDGEYTASSVPVAWSYGTTEANGTFHLSTRMVNYSDNSTVWSRGTGADQKYTIWVLVAKAGAADYRGYDAYRTTTTVSSADVNSIIPNNKFNSTVQTTGPNMP